MPISVDGEKDAWKGGVVGATRYLSLHAGAAATSANELSSVAGSKLEAAGYARVAITSAQWTLSDVTGAASNNVLIQWADPVAGADWPAVLTLGAWSAAVGGTLRFSEAIPGAPMIAINGDRARFEIGQLVLDF